MTATDIILATAGLVVLVMLGRLVVGRPGRRRRPPFPASLKGRMAASPFYEKFRSN